MTPRFPVLKPQRVIRALERAGFKTDHQTGSHVVMRRTSDGCRIVVPRHNRDLGRGLTLQIVKTAGLTRDEFLELFWPCGPISASRGARVVTAFCPEG